MPLPIRSRLASLVALASVVACSSTGEQQADAADTGAAAVAATASGDGASCFVRGSIEEARTRQSPLGELRFTVGGDEVLLCYGRPSARGRTMIGGVE